MKWYSVVFNSYKRKYRGCDVYTQSFNYFVQANSVEEANGMGLKKSREMHPPEEGWHLLDVNSIPCPTND